MLNKVKSAYGGKKAFTLIELLIVIAIIAILAAIILISLNSARNRARDTQVKADMSSLSKALEIVKVDQSLTGTGWTRVTDSIVAGWKDIDGKALISHKPTFPFTGSVPGVVYDYSIKINDTSDYGIIAPLTTNNNWWCVKNATGWEIKNKSQVSARNECSP